MNRRAFLTSAAAAALVPVVPKSGNVVYRCRHIPQPVERWVCVASGGDEYAVGSIVTLTHSVSGEDFRGKWVRT